MSSKRILVASVLVVALVAIPCADRAAEPPDLVDYQGVLRGAADAPLNGDFDMIFRFYSAETGGDEIFIDRHALGAGTPVTVTGGLFRAQLGGGATQDGAGPHVFTSLGEVFAAYSEVWLAIEVGGEVLSPRARIVSSPYAANAARLGGKEADEFLDTSTVTQTKLGKLVVGAAAGTANAYGIEAYGASAGGYFKDATYSGYAYAGRGDTGLHAYGDYTGGYFEDLDDGSYAYAGRGQTGVLGAGSLAGGYFSDVNSSGYCYAGYGEIGVTGHGNAVGGYFTDTNESGYAWVAHGDRGISAYGNLAGGLFEDLNHSGQAYVGYGDEGVHASGNEAGGYFEDTDDGGFAYVGYGDFGIAAYGDDMGGYFQNLTDGSYARAGYETYGVWATGSGAGGHFEDSDGSGHAKVGSDNTGIVAYGNDAGGYFENTAERSQAWLAYGDYGIEAHGDEAGGYFRTFGGTGRAWVGYGNRGIWAKGSFAGGTFSHWDDVTYWADVALIRDSTTYKIRGTGTVSFVQNHPYDKDKLVVYAAPEGDEVAVYTRGTARLRDGEAHVTLGETFALVANPDIGLTAHVTPREETIALSVVEVSTSELTVRGPAGSDAAFDYLVHGLRIGFEEHSPVQTKDREAFLPPREAAESFYAQHPELRRHNALERFKSMRVALGESRELDLSRTEALVAAIDHNRAEIVAAARERATNERAERDFRPEPPADAERPPTAAVEPAASTAEPAPLAGVDEIRAEPELEEQTWLAVVAPVEPGDLLALAPELSGRLRRVSLMADPNVVGVAAASSREAADGGLEAPIAVSGIVELRADAGYGEIRPGDLLVASPTPGHAMRALEIVPGTLVAKAIDPLAMGTGTIRVLVMLR